MFEHFPAAIFFVFDDIIHHTEFDNGIAIGTHPGIHEEVMDILQTAGYIIQAVFAFPVFIVFAGDGYSIELSGQEVFGILEGQAYFSQPASTAAFRAVEHETFEVFASEVADFVFTDYPTDTVDDIAFATTVRTDYPRNTFIKMQGGFVGKTFESFDF